jgi:hypothetical protein
MIVNTAARCNEIVAARSDRPTLEYMWRWLTLLGLAACGPRLGPPIVAPVEAEAVGVSHRPYQGRPWYLQYNVSQWLRRPVAGEGNPVLNERDFLGDAPASPPVTVPR